MLEAVFSMFGQALQTILNKKAEEIASFGGDDVASWKRGAIGIFFDLYDALYNIEKDTKAIFQYLVDCKENPKSFSNVAFARRLEKVDNHFEQLGASLSKVQSLLRVYDDRLYVEIEGARQIKGAARKRIYFWAKALPKTRDKNGKLLRAITFWKSVPNRQDVENLVGDLRFRQLSHAQLAEKMEEVSMKVLSEVDIGKVNLEDVDEISEAIASVAKTTDDIEDCRLKMGEFIKSNFDLNEIVK